MDISLHLAWLFRHFFRSWRTSVDQYGLLRAFQDLGASSRLLMVACCCCCYCWAVGRVVFFDVVLAVTSTSSTFSSTFPPLRSLPHWILVYVSLAENWSNSRAPWSPVLWPALRYPTVESPTDAYENFQALDGLNFGDWMTVWNHSFRLIRTTGQPQHLGFGRFDAYPKRCPDLANFENSFRQIGGAASH